MVRQVAETTLKVLGLGAGECVKREGKGGRERERGGAEGGSGRGNGAEGVNTLNYYM